MSQMDGLFSLRTPQDLLAKLEHDFGRLEKADPTRPEAQYAAYDFFVTALHLADWQHKAVGGSLASHRAYPEGPLVTHLGNGAKHFRVDTARHRTVADTGSAGFFDPAFFDPAAFDVVRLVVDLEDGSTVDVMDIALRVLAHWRGELESGPLTRA